MSIDPTVTYESRDGNAWLGLNRPRKCNAINERCLPNLIWVFAAVRKTLGRWSFSVTARVSQPVSTLASTALDGRSRSTTPHALGMRRSRHYGMVVFR